MHLGNSKACHLRSTHDNLHSMIVIILPGKVNEFTLDIFFYSYSMTIPGVQHFKPWSLFKSQLLLLCL